MAFLGTLFDGSKGAGYQASGPAAQELSNTYNQANTQLQGTIGANAQDAEALKGGIGNLQNSYGQSNALAASLAPGAGNLQNTYGQLNNIAQNGSALANAQLTNATNQGIQQAAGVVAGAKGINPALAARMAGQQAGQMGQQAANNSAMLQAQTQMSAMGQAGQLAGQQVAGQQAAIGQGANIAGQQVAGRQNALGANAGIQQGMANTAAGILQGQNTANAGIAQQNSKGQSDIIGGVFGGLGQAAAMSDERMKTDVHSGDAKLQQMLDSIGAHDYRYNQQSQGIPGAGSGRHISPMAQELEQSEAGRDMVVNTPNGKMVDYGKGFGTIMAAQALLNKRLDALEGKKHVEGQAQHFANGGMPIAPLAPPAIAPRGPQSSIGKILAGMGSGFQSQPNQSGMSQAGNAIGQGLMTGIGALFGGPSPQAAPAHNYDADMAAGHGASPMDVFETARASRPPQQSSSSSMDSPMDAPAPPALARGGKVPVKSMVSPGEIYLNPQEAQEVAQGKKSPMAGEMIPGKAKVKGDSLKNDTVPKTLEQGGVVIPRSVLESKNPHQQAYQFVNAHLAKMNKGGKVK